MAGKRYSAKQSAGFHWLIVDSKTGRETMADSKAQAQRLAKLLNERESGNG
jgi:hypothetical protein